MNIDMILRALEHNTGRFPREALEAAIEQREKITPHLLAILEQAIEDIDHIVEDEAYMAHLYAFFLLAQFREERAYPLIVEFFSIPGEVTLEVTSDFVTESLGRVLASVSGGDMGPMRSLAENPALNGYVRSAALGGMVCLVAEGVKPREEVVAYFRSLFRGKLERTYSHIWDGLVSWSTTLYPEELMPEIHQVFADDLIDELFIDLNWIDQVMAEGKAATLERMRDSRHRQFIEDTIAEMEWWACFEETTPPPPSVQVAPKPVSRKKKIGRNVPCPCGSGRKYKHCCGKRR
jgi:hypothetical protein